MEEMFEKQIREALDAQARAVEVPHDLPRRTLEMAAEQGDQPRTERRRTSRDSRPIRVPVAGRAPAIYTASAAAVAAALFAVGSHATPAGRVSNALLGRFEDMRGSSGRAARDGLTQADRDTIRRASTGIPGAPLAYELPYGGGSSAGETAPEPTTPPAPRALSIEGATFQPQIARTAIAQIEVGDFDPAWTEANAIAARYGGYVTGSNTEQVSGHLGRGTVSIHVPADRLDPALADLRRIGKLVRMTTSANDVSAPIADVRARLKTLQTEEIALLDLLRQAQNLQQTLLIRDRLRSTREDIESLQAQSKLYENQVSYSTIEATIYEKGAPVAENVPDTMLEVALASAVRIGLTVVGGLLIVLGGLAPLAALAFAAMLLLGAVRRRRAL